MFIQTIKDFIGAVKIRSEYKAEIKSRDAAIREYKNTIKRLLEEKKRQNTDQMTFHFNERDEIKKEVSEYYEIIISQLKKEIEELKKRFNDNWGLWEAIREKMRELEELRMKIREYMTIAKNYSQESMRHSNNSIMEIDGFEKGFNKLENKIKNNMGDCFVIQTQEEEPLDLIESKIAEGK